MKKTDIQRFIRKDIGQMEPYVPGATAWDLAKKYKQKVSDLIKLNANENPYGPSPLVRKALQKEIFFNYYPDGAIKILRRTLAKYVGTGIDNIIVGNGSDEVMDLILRLVLNPEEKVINCVPSFDMYPMYIRLNRGIVLSIPRNNDFSINLPAIKGAIDKKTKAIFLCSPNNPTGNITPLAIIEALLRENIFVIVDEAYFEFCGITALSLLKKYPNLIILRTLSKWAGLAGLRIGYGIMNPFLVKQILKIKSPFTINLAGQETALATVKNLSFAKKAIKKIIAERKRLFQILSKINDLKVYPSETNFLFIQLENHKYAKLQKLFEKNKIAIRFYNSPYSGTGIRLTIGKPAQNDKVISLFRKK